MIIYVCGFAFSPDETEVAVILKNRPTFLAGKYNGIGGKVESDEGIYEAMVREFKEEAGVPTEEDDWCVLGSMKFLETFDKAVVYFFKAILTQAEFDAIETQEDEPVHKVDADTLWSQMEMDAYARIYLLAAIDSRTVVELNMEVI